VYQPASTAIIAIEASQPRQGLRDMRNKRATLGK
jgi:hypothetical protein